MIEIPAVRRLQPSLRTRPARTQGLVNLFRVVEVVYSFGRIKSQKIGNENECPSIILRRSVPKEERAYGADEIPLGP